MNAESLALLEYEALRALVGRWVSSENGRRRLAAMHPGTDRAVLTGELLALREAMMWLDESSKPKTRGAEPPARLRFDGIPETGAAVSKLQIDGAVLDTDELLGVAGLLERAQEVRAAIAAAAGRFPRLGRIAASIANFREAVRAITGNILPDGTVADHASPLLAKLRRDVERQRRQVRASLENFLKSHREDGLLQEEFVTIRNDRFVVPVVPGAKRRAPGVIHGSSGSGHTLFLEPLETIEHNNDLVRLNEEELREIHRILREMTNHLRRQADEVRQAAEALGELDFLFGKARFAEAFDCTVPRFTAEEEPKLSLEGARHPLLEDVLRRQKRPIVPVSFTLDGTTRTLLISGPNTGGKTVTLKTAGLLCLMAQSGLPVPAEKAEAPIFDDVLADIGDNQSIEQSLSSFSAHVMRIREMVGAAASGALVLLDELGRATDPEEGGALGVAILEEFRGHGAFTLASTHLLALKVYGATTPGVLNASMGFDQESLEPTYVLRTGAPGKSSGLEIAARIGLPARLLARARAAMTDRERDISHFLSELEARIAEAKAESAAWQGRRSELEEEVKEMRRRAEQRETQRLRDIEAGAQEAMARFEREARSAIEQALSAPEMRKQAERTQRQASRTKRELREQVEALKGGKPATRPEPDKLLPGARLRLKDVGEPAKVLRVLSGGLLEVEIGLLKMQVAPHDVLEVLPAASGGGSKLPKGVTFTPGPRFETLTRELNIIGKTAEEAEAEVERFLDSAALADVVRVRVVHGHGMGVLRKLVQTLLGRHPMVEKFYAAGPAEGGTGATIAELKND